MIESYQKNPRERYKTVSEEDKSKRQRITKKDIKVLPRKVKKSVYIIVNIMKIFMKNKGRSKD